MNLNIFQLSQLDWVYMNAIDTKTISVYYERYRSRKSKHRLAKQWQGCRYSTA